MMPSKAVKSAVRFAATANLNFTNRIDIPRSDVDFAICETPDGNFAYTVTLLTWAAMNHAFAPESLVSLSFHRPNTRLRTRAEHGTFRQLIGRGGVSEGVIPGIGNPANIELRLLLTSPSDHRILGVASKPRPDRVALQEPDLPEDEALRPRGCAVRVVEDATVSGNWDVAMGSNAMPLLMIHPDLGRHRVETDPALQAAIFPEVFRRVVSALVFHDEVYGDLEWAAKWRGLAARHSPTGEWRFFTGRTDEGDEIDVATATENIALGVNSYKAATKLDSAPCESAALED
jgi:hypothetical protein